MGLAAAYSNSRFYYMYVEYHIVKIKKKMNLFGMLQSVTC